jgi:hypothetical protein
MTSRSLTALFLTLILATVSVYAGDLPLVELDFTANPKLFDTHFGRYGPRPTRIVYLDGRGLRLRLSNDKKDVKKVGLYSYFALSGDFEIAVNYEVLEITPPITGDGAGFGIGIENNGTEDILSVRRGEWKDLGSGVELSSGRPTNDKMKNEPHFFPTKTKKGQIVLRRAKNVVVLLTSDSPTAELVELTRISFTGATIRTVRVFVDSGGSPTTVDCRLTGLTIRAEEITGGIPERDQPHTPEWVFVVAIILAVAIGLGLWWVLARRRKTALRAG